MAADMANGGAAILGHLLDDLDEFLAALLAEFGNTMRRTVEVAGAGWSLIRKWSYKLHCFLLWRLIRELTANLSHNFPFFERSYVGPYLLIYKMTVLDSAESTDYLEIL